MRPSRRARPWRSRRSSSFFPPSFGCAAASTVALLVEWAALLQADATRKKTGSLRGQALHTALRARVPILPLPTGSKCKGERQNLPMARPLLYYCLFAAGACLSCSSASSVGGADATYDAKDAASQATTKKEGGNGDSGRKDGGHKEAGHKEAGHKEAGVVHVEGGSSTERSGRRPSPTCCSASATRSPTSPPSSTRTTASRRARRRTPSASAATAAPRAASATTSRPTPLPRYARQTSARPRTSGSAPSRARARQSAVQAPRRVSLRRGGPSASPRHARPSSPTPAPTRAWMPVTRATEGTPRAETREPIATRP